MANRSDGSEHARDGGAGIRTGKAMARKPATHSVDDIHWFDPAAGVGLPFLWDDAIHVVKRVEFGMNEIAYSTHCGQMFIVPRLPGQILEAKIRLPKPNCARCISWNG